MGLPSKAKTWTISANNRETSGTVLTCMQKYALSLKNFLKTTMGYTVNSSCSNGTAGTIGDGIDRWSVSTDVTPRNNGAGGSMAWFILVDGNSAQICLSFNASSDDTFRLAYSPGANYVTAGTANQQPTATDEVLVWGGNSSSIVSATSGNDRVWHMWGSSDKKMFRAVVFRSNSPISFWGVELVTSAVVSPATFSPAMWGFGYMLSGGTMMRLKSAAGSIMGAGQSPPTSEGGGSAYVFSASANRVIVVGGGGEIFATQNGNNATSWPEAFPALQGRQGYIISSLTLQSQTTNANGKLGNRIDWWVVASATVSTVPADLTCFGTGGTSHHADFVSLGSTLHPWDGTTVPLTA